MDNKTDIMKAKAYIKARHEELEDRYKNALEEHFDGRDEPHIKQNRIAVYKDQAFVYKDEFQIVKYIGMNLIEEIQAMQCRDEFLLDSEISVIISRLKIIVADCLIKEYALRYELDERDKNDDE